MSSIDAAIYNEARKAASGAQLWVSGMTVTQRQEVRSPLDGEIYRRKTATGSGATDPADDLTNYIAVSYVRSTALPLKTSAWIALGASISAYYAFGIPKTTPGLIATGVRTQILSLTGHGGVGFIGFFANASSATFRIEVICDGRTIYDATSAPGIASTSMTILGNTFPGTPPGAPSVSQEGFGSPDTNGPRFRRSFQVYLTPTVGTFPATGVLAASYWSES